MQNLAIVPDDCHPFIVGLLHPTCLGIVGKCAVGDNPMQLQHMFWCERFAGASELHSPLHRLVVVEHHLLGVDVLLGWAVFMEVSVRLFDRAKRILEIAL